MLKESSNTMWDEVLLVGITFIVTLVLREIFGYFKSRFFGRRVFLKIDFRHNKNMAINTIKDGEVSLKYRADIEIVNISGLAAYDLEVIFPNKKKAFEAAGVKEHPSLAFLPV